SPIPGGGSGTGGPGTGMPGGSPTDFPASPSTPPSGSPGPGSGGQPSGGPASGPAAPVTGGPSAANTGVPAGTNLTVHLGDLVITEPGTVIDGLDIHGFVEVRAANVTVRRSLIRGGVATSLRGVVQNNDPAATGFLLEDSEIRPAHPSVWLTGVKGANYTMRRVHVNGGVVDGAMASGSHVRVESSYLHGLVSYAVDPTHPDGSHNDGVQVVGGSDITITGNTILAGTGQNSVLQVTQDIGPTRQLTFSDNWVDGGTCSVKLTHQGGTALGPVTVSGNRFGRGMSISGCAILRTGATTLAASGNTWPDGRPVAVRTYG
ncbi:MAG TPA: right-handed parallel beta-helix repeat-containing protein, partial [Kineosporiaceae bacterium]|nr:right-handed parallel beta-helix repeat-containing protein [Kineosporiaceae bacterium]